MGRQKRNDELGAGARALGGVVEAIILLPCFTPSGRFED